MQNQNPRSQLTPRRLGPTAPLGPMPQAHAIFTQKPPKTRHAPTHARHKTCKPKKSRVSPYVTLENAPRRAPLHPPARAPRRLAVWRWPTSRSDIAMCHRLCIHHGPVAPPRLRPQATGLGSSPPKNHPKREAPQHMPATALASVRQNFLRLLSPCKSHLVTRSRPSQSHPLEPPPEPCIMHRALAPISKGVRP